MAMIAFFTPDSIAFAACEITITAEGEDLGAPYKSTVTIGIGMVAETLPSPPSPPEYSCEMKILSSDWSKLAKDIRQGGEAEYCWIIGVNPHGPGLAPDRTCTVSWDASKLGNGMFELRKGDDCEGMLEISDMSAVDSFPVTGSNKLQYFSIVYRPGPLDLSDVLSILKFLAKDRELDYCKPVFNMDINNDGRVGLAECIFILERISGIRPD